MYADTRGQAEPMKLNIGDSVLIKQRRVNKYTPKFDPKPLQISDVHGSTVRAQIDGITVTRNQSFFKKIDTSKKRDLTERNSPDDINKPDAKVTPRYTIQPMNMLVPNKAQLRSQRSDDLPESLDLQLG